MMIRIVVAAVLAGLSPATATAQTAPAPAPALAPAPDYVQDSAWLCLPRRADDPCGAPLPTTALNPNGYGSVGRSSIAADAPVDCFYVYPTVSRDPTMNSDLDAGPEERGAATNQFARFAEVCRPFAPIYRSITLPGLMMTLSGQSSAAGFGIAYDDVRNAWRQFLASRNNGRPFVLVGHSQGTVHLQRLIREEIEGKPIAANMVSALLMGFNTEVPEGQVTGGTFASTPICTSLGQTGCIVTYVSYRADAPPPEGALFGRAATQGRTVACTNPATLARGAAPLDSYWSTTARPQPGVEPIAWSSQGAPPTPFVRTEGLYTGECVHDGRLGYLAIRVAADPVDARTDRIPGDVYLGGRLTPGWGLHTADVPIAQGDLIRLVARQARSLRTRRSGERG